MAQSLEDAEFWLPPRFLTDDDIFMDTESFNKNDCGGRVGTGFGPTVGFPSEFPYEFDSFSSSSALSSPVESVVGSTETESSDEEDFFVGLTRRLAQSTIHDSQKLAVPNLAQDKSEVRFRIFSRNFLFILPIFFFLEWVTEFGLCFC